VVLKDSDVFLAQIAPAQAYLRAAGKVRALPVHPSWQTAHISATPFVQNSALGSSLFSDPEMYRLRWQPGDMLLICSSNIARVLGAAAVDELLSRDTPDEAIEQVQALCVEHELTDACGIAVGLQESATRAEPAVSARQPETRRAGQQHRSIRSWFGQRSEPAAAADPEDTTAAQPLDSADHQPAALTEEEKPEPPALLPPFPPKPLPIDVGENLEERHERDHVSHLPPSALLGERDYEQTASAPQQPIDLSDVAALAAYAQPYRPSFERRPLADMSLGERLALPFQWLGSKFEKRSNRRSLRRAQPADTPPPRRGKPLRVQRTPEPPKQAGFRGLIFLVFALTVALLILYGLNMSRQVNTERTVVYLEEAEERLDTVFDAPNREQAAVALADFEQAMDEVRASPQITVTNATLWLRYQDLVEGSQRAQSSIYLVNFLRDLTVLAEHPLPGGRFASVVVPETSTTITATEMLEAREYIYALDGNSEAAQLYRIPRDGGTPEPFLSPNDLVRDTVVGPLQAQAWRVNNVIAIDQGNNGFGYYLRDSNGWTHIRLGGSEIWNPRGRIDLETYLGNLYVWGAESNEILKYPSGRYGDIPQLWINPEGLAGRDIGAAIDMAVDGLIYLLQPDGTVLVLSGGSFEREIVPESLTPPISAVTRFFATGTSDAGWLFLLDTLNERVIQVDKATGEIVQQVRTDPESNIRLNQLTDLYVDTSTNRPILYLVNGNQIVRATLPGSPEPFEPAANEDSADAAPTSTDSNPTSIP
jgi:hypothetical protein